LSLSIAELIVLEAARQVPVRGSNLSAVQSSDSAWMPGVSFEVDVESPLHELLARRMSSRDLAGSIDFGELQHLLSLLAVPVGNQRRRLGAATTGGLGAQKLLCLVSSVEGLNPGVYEVDWSRGALQPLMVSAEAVSRVLEKVSTFMGAPSATPAVVMLCIADWHRLSSAYENGVLVSALWDAGSMLAHLYLAASEIGVGCCAVSALDDGTFVTAAELDPERWGHVGTFAIGRSAAISPA